MFVGKPATFDPSRVLGCTPSEAEDLLRGRRVTPGEVETVAAQTYDWRRHLHDPGSYWVTVAEAARILRLPPGAVRRLLDEDRLPHVVHSSGVRLMRRHQLEERRKVRAEGDAGTDVGGDAGGDFEAHVEDASA